MFPLDTAKALAQEHAKGIEKKDLTVAFIPSTCATPIIMAEPMGFYAKHGLNVTVRRASGWAVIRDWAINKEVDATHMLSPMPLSITLGVGSPAVPYFMPAVENINGQAITLPIKHKDVKGPQDMKGFRFCMEWNNLHIAGILFAILIVGAVGVTLDAGFNRLARFVTYTE